MKLSRILLAALAVAAMLAPTAAARPIDGPVSDMRSSVAEALAKQHRQDAKNRAQAQQLPGPPTWPAHPTPIAPPSTERSLTGANQGDDGVDWATIGIGVGLTFVALGAITGVTHRIRVRHQRPRVVG